jgi:hypothetical protein
MRGLISTVTNAAAGIVTVHEDTRHGLQTGQYVTFEEVEGRYPTLLSPASCHT